MKIRLNKSLRAALMACYAVSAPIATTVTTGAIVAGAVGYTTLAPQAMATAPADTTDYTEITATGSTAASDLVFDNLTGKIWMNMEGTTVNGGDSWFDAGGTCYASEIWVDNWLTDNGYSSGNYTFNSIITGDGDIQPGYNGTNTYVFNGDMSAWTGSLVPVRASVLVTITDSYNADTDGDGEADYVTRTAASGQGAITLSNSSTLTYNFANDATIANTSITTPTITFSTSSSDGITYTLNSSVAATTFTINSNVTVEASKDITATTLTLAANAILSNQGAMTLSAGTINASGATISNASGATLTLASGTTLTADSSLTVDLDGTVVVNAAEQIVVADADYLTIDSSTIFDLSKVSFTTDGDYLTFQLFDVQDSDLSNIWEYYSLDEDNITGLVGANDGTEYVFNSDGSLSYKVAAVLSYSAGGDFIWTTDAGEGPATFTNSSDDSVEYSSGAILTIKTASASATLGSDVDPAQLIIDGTGVDGGIVFTLTGSGYKMDSDLVSFVGDATLVLEDDVLGEHAVIGTGGVTTATVLFSLDSGVAVDYTNQLKGFAGNLILSQGTEVDGVSSNVGTITIGDASVEGFDSSSVTLNYNTVEVSGGTLNLGYDLNTTSITVNNGATVANFGGDVTVSGALTLNNGTSTFDGDVSATSLTTKNTVTFNKSLSLSGGLSMTAGEATFEGAVKATSYTSTGGEAYFNGGFINSGTMTLTSTDVTFGGTNSFTYLVLSDSLSSITLLEGATLTSTDSSSYAYTQDLEVNLAADSELTINLNFRISSGKTWTLNSVDGEGGEFTLNQDLILAYTGGSGTLIVGSGVTVNANDNIIFGNGDTYTGTLTLNGTLNSAAAMIEKDGNGTITVGSTGNLVLASGTTTEVNDYTLTTNLSGTLTLGNQASGDTIDYSEGGMTINVLDGAKITDNGADVTTYHTMVYTTEASAITFAGSSTGSLTIASKIDAANVSATIDGKVTFAGSTNLASVTVSTDAVLSISSDYTFNSAITNNGTVSILDGASLDISSLIDKTLYGDYSITLIEGGEVTLDTAFDCATYFTEASLDGLTNVSFVDGVLYYTIAGDIIRYGSGESISLGIGEVVNEVTYSDTTQVVLQDLPVTVKLTTDVATEYLGVDGIVATFATENGSELDSGNIVISNAGTLVVTGDILGDNASFTNSDSDATIEFVLGADDTVSYTDQLSGFTGTIAISGDGVYLDTSDGAQTFTKVIVNEGATFKLDGLSWNIDDDITRSVTLVGGEDADSTATFSASNSSVRADFSLSGYVTLDATNSTFNLYGDIVNTGGEDDMLIKTGTGTLYVYGDANYTGDLDIQAGGISFESTITGALDDITMASGTSLSFANAVTVGSLALNGGTASFNGGLTLADSTSLSISSGSTLNISTSTNITSLISNSATVGLTNVSAADMLYTVSGSNNVLNLSGTTTLNSIEASSTAGNGYSLTINVADSASASFDYSSPSSSANDLVSNSNYVYAYRTQLDIVLGSNSTLDMDASFWIAQYAWTISMDENATNGVVSVNGMLVGYSESTSLTINAGATLEIEGTTLASNAYTSSFTVGGSGNAATVDIYGTLEANSGIYRHGTGNGTINVQSGGLLIMNDGLKAISAYETGTLSLNVLSGGVLSLGNQSDDTTDYNGEITVNISNGATITDNGEEAKTTVYTTLTYAEGATVNFATSAAGQGLVIASAVGNTTDSVSANVTGGGTVYFDGLTDLATLDIASVTDDEGNTVTSTADFQNTSTVTTLTGAGNLTVNCANEDDDDPDNDLTGNLTITDASGFTGALGIDANVTILGSDEGQTINLSGLNLISGSLTVGENVTITEGDGASSTIGSSSQVTGDFVLTINGDSTVSSSDRLLLYEGSDFTLNGTGTYSVTGIQMGSGSTDATELTIGTGATMEITGANTNVTTSTAFNLGFYNTSNTISISGTLIVDAAMTAGNGKSDITVYSGGMLQLNSGLDFTRDSSYTSSTISTITVNSGGTLALGNGEQTTDSDYLTVTMTDGSTLAATADEDVTVYEDITYSGNVTFDGTESKLTMASQVDSTAATIEGKVEYAYGTSADDANDIAEITLNTGAELTVSGIVNADSVANETVQATPVVLKAASDDGIDSSVTIETGGALNVGSTSFTNDDDDTTSATIDLAGSGTAITASGDDAVVSGSVSVSNASISSDAGNLVVSSGSDLAITSSDLTSASIELTGGSLSLDDVIIGSGTTITDDGVTAGSNVTIKDATVAVDDTNWTSSTTSADTYTITTFDSLTSYTTVTVEGTINLEIALSDEAYSQFITSYESGEVSIILDFGSGEVTESLDNVGTVALSITNSDYDTIEAITATGTFDQISGETSLTITIPEPSTTALSLVALAGLLARRRRKA